MAVINAKIRKTEACDIDALMEIIAEARGTIAALGIDQWQDGYPQRSVIEADVAGDVSYCFEDTNSGRILGTFAVFENGEPFYDRIIDGEWRTGESLSSLGENVTYTAVHRVAISVASRGSGLSRKMIDFVGEMAKGKGKKSLRIDTHEGNVVMRKMLEKFDFKHCGTIFVDGGAARVAYEKLI